MIDEVRLIEDIHAYFRKKIDADETEIIDHDILTLNKEICKIVHEQHKVNEWIPCSERLPEIEEYILMSFRNLDVAIGFRSNTENYWYYGGQYLTHDSVVAWMPLPEPY